MNNLTERDWLAINSSDEVAMFLIHLREKEQAALRDVLDADDPEETLRCKERARTFALVIGTPAEELRLAKLESERIAREEQKSGERRTRRGWFRRIERADRTADRTAA